MILGEKANRIDPSSSLFWMGAALIGVFSATVLTGLLPPGVLLLDWQVKASALILASAPYAAIGAILILLAAMLDSDSDELEKWVRRLRLWAIPTAIGFFLLVPLQTYNSYRLLKIASGEERQSISQLQKTLGAIQSAQDETELRAAVSQLPGAPTTLGKMNIPLPKAKQSISERLGGEIKRLENKSDELNSKRWQESLVILARNCILSLCYGAGFAEIAHFPKSRNSLLFSILILMPWNHKMRWRRN